MKKATHLLTQKERKLEIKKTQKKLIAEEITARRKKKTKNP